MSTRGLLGIRVNNTDKFTYNHSDSYPSELGRKLVSFCNELTNQHMWPEVRILAEALKDISSTKPTFEEVKKFSKHANLNVSNGDPCDWYVLLRETQGSIAKILDSGVYINANEFINESLFCEYGYVVNLDTMKLELYEGGQRKRHDKGRYAHNPPIDNFYPCALVAEYPLEDIPASWSACFKAEA